jgi:hypothetical protein
MGMQLKKGSASTASSFLLPVYHSEIFMLALDNNLCFLLPCTLLCLQTSLLASCYRKFLERFGISVFEIFESYEGNLESKFRTLAKHLITN